MRSLKIFFFIICIDKHGFWINLFAIMLMFIGHLFLEWPIDNDLAIIVRMTFKLQNHWTWWICRGYLIIEVYLRLCHNLHLESFSQSQMRVVWWYQSLQKILYLFHLCFYFHHLISTRLFFITKLWWLSLNSPSRDTFISWFNQFKAYLVLK